MIKENIQKKDSWFRIIFIIIYAIIWAICNFLMKMLIIFNTVYFLLSCKPNKSLQELGNDLAVYINKVLLYVTFNSDEKPFPLDEDKKSNTQKAKKTSTTAKK